MQTMDLWQKALTQARQTDWAARLGVDDSAFSMAKKRGRLSPQLAGDLAKALGEEPRDWIALAAIEAMPDNDAQKRLKKACHYS